MESVYECIRFLEGPENEVSEQQIKNCIEFLYESATTIGLGCEDIRKLIDCLCITDIIGAETKEFIITRCLVPNEYVDAKCITLIISKLGTPTFLHPYKTVPGRRLQVALVRWVCHIYPWVKDKSIFKDTFSIWFEYWRLDYLQHWITYILLWTFDDRHISKWRCKVLFNIGNNPGYKNSRAYSVYILDAFLALETDLKDIISDFIQMLNSNEKSLQKIASFDYDRQFVLNTRQALSAKNLLDDDQFEEILKNYGDRKAYMKPEQTNILSLEKLARNWNNFDGPYDFTRLLKFKSDVMWLKIAGHASTDPRIIQFRSYLRERRDSRTLFRDVPFPLLHTATDFDLRTAKLSVAFSARLCIEDEADGVIEIIMQICHASFFAISSDNFKHALNIYHAILATDILSSLTNKKTEVSLVLSALLLRSANIIGTQKHFPLIHALADHSIEQVVAVNDPLLISELCWFLVRASAAIHPKHSPEILISDIDKSIHYLVEVLWNHNVTSSGSTLLPNSYWESLRQSQYLSHTSFPSKLLYSVPNFGFMCFICQKLLFEKERTLGYEHFLGDFSERTLKQWVTKLGSNPQWFQEINQFSDLRKHFLRMVRSDYRYSGISEFLFTYVKNLQDIP